MKHYRNLFKASDGKDTHLLMQSKIFEQSYLVVCRVSVKQRFKCSVFSSIGKISFSTNWTNFRISLKLRKSPFVCNKYDYLSYKANFWSSKITFQIKCSHSQRRYFDCPIDLVTIDWTVQVLSLQKNPSIF